MEAHPILAAGDLGRIGAATHDGAHDGRITRSVRCRREDDAIAEPQAGVGGEPLVYGNSPRLLRARTRQGPRSILGAERRGMEREEDEKDRRATRQRRAEADQCAVSFSDSRVSTSVYEGAA